MTREIIEEYLMKNRRSLPGLSYAFGLDTNQDPPEQWDKANIRILVTFLSTGETRSVSNTFTCINTLFHQGAPEEDTFVDVCYLPEAETREAFAKDGIPFMFGNVSHRPWNEYDVIAVSQAIMPEVINVPWMYNNSGVPLSTESRNQAKTPLILYGGAAAICATPILSGKIEGGKGLIDLAMIGAGEPILPRIMSTLHIVKRELGSIRDNREETLKRLLSDSYTRQHVLIPTEYEVVYKPDNCNIDHIEYLNPETPKKVKINHVEEAPQLGFQKKIFNISGENATSADIEISTGCSGGSACCSFCLEANEANGWTEIDFEHFKEEVQNTKRWAAPNTMSLFSFNSNYYYRYIDALDYLAQNSSNLSLINMRADSVGADPEYTAVAKRLGLKRIGLAVEGMSDRIRNHIFNKNLPKDLWMAAARVAFENKLILLKHGMMLYGGETDEDVEEFIRDMTELLSIRDEVGANTAIQLSFTPLVIYEGTPLRWMPRVTAYNSFHNIRTMGKFLDWAKGKVRSKFNGRGCGTYIEQLLLDLGFAGTQFLQDAQQDGLIYERNFGDKHKEIVLKALDKNSIPFDFIFPERPLDYVFSSDVIELTEPKLFEEWKENHKKQDFQKQICLKTPANLNPKCYGCGACPNGERIKWTTTRPLESKTHMEGILETLSNNRCKYAVKLVLTMRKDSELYSRTTLAHYVTAHLLRKSEELADAFFGVSKNTTSWTSNNGQMGWFGGKWVYDIQFKRPVDINTIKKLVPEVNKELTVTRIEAVEESAINLEPANTDTILYMGRIQNLSMSRLNDKLTTFDWNVKEAIKGMGGLETKSVPAPELKKRILVAQSGPEILMTMTLKANQNPYLVLSSIIGKSVEYCYANSLFIILEHGQPVDAVCSCGDKLIHSYTQGKVVSKCPTCQARALLYKTAHK